MRRIAFVLHDFNTWEGHSRSTMEIAKRLSLKTGVDLYSFTFDDRNHPRPGPSSGWGDARWFHIRPDFRKPFPLRASIFYASTLLQTGQLPGWDRSKRPLIHATGACTLMSDVVQVQFVQAAWKRARERHPHLAFPGEGLKAGLRRLYHRGLSHFNIATEKMAFHPRKTYIAIADVVRDELADFYDLRENVHVIHHGVDSSLFRPAAGPGEVRELRAELGLPGNKIVVSFVGALARKGLSTAIQAWSQVAPAAREKAVLFAVGGGMADEFKAQAERLGVGASVLFLPFSKEIQNVYRASDAFLLPTLYEPFGLVILEAMSCGLPPVVTKLAGASELITEGVDGLLIHDPGDSVSIAKHLEALIQDGELRARMSQRARATAETYSWDAVAEKYEKVLFPLAGI